MKLVVGRNLKLLPDQNILICGGLCLTLDYPWTGMLFGGTIVGIWYWCTDQYIVQRTLSAQNIKIGRRGAIFGAYLKLLPIFIFLIPGIVAFALKQKGIITYEKSDEVFPVLVSTLLPTGVKGLVAGGLMAALMSSLASVFNSSSTLFTVDIFKNISAFARVKAG